MIVHLQKKIDTWIFDLDNTLYSADSGIFQQVSVLMGEFVSKHLSLKKSATYSYLVIPSSLMKLSVLGSVPI